MLRRKPAPEFQIFDSSLISTLLSHSSFSPSLITLRHNPLQVLHSIQSPQSTVPPTTTSSIVLRSTFSKPRQGSSVLCSTNANKHGTSQSPSQSPSRILDLLHTSSVPKLSVTLLTVVVPSRLPILGIHMLQLTGRHHRQAFSLSPQLFAHSHSVSFTVTAAPPRYLVILSSLSLSASFKGMVC
jgi:hypothetical protein